MNTSDNTVKLCRNRNTHTQSQRHVRTCIHSDA